MRGRHESRCQRTVGLAAWRKSCKWKGRLVPIASVGQEVFRAAGRVNNAESADLLGTDRHNNLACQLSRHHTLQRGDCLIRPSGPDGEKNGGARVGGRPDTAEISDSRFKSSAS
ncbi:hypothetical protein [Kibdelosporangium philippinense]|uniref:hypothetical protein n=1 Tax=Kibdelosporangium philippinense TaxID=211113 RepID=UPI0036183546